MLPWKTARGREAFKRIMCYVGVPAKLKEQKPETVAVADVSKLPNVKYTTVEDIAKEIGGKR
jgi:large subunit ribosomal protein L13